LLLLLGVRHALAQIVRNEGIAGLYRGLSPNLVGSGVSWGCYFFTYNLAKSTVREHLGKLVVTHLFDCLLVIHIPFCICIHSVCGMHCNQIGLGPKDRLDAPYHLACAGTAGTVTTLLTNPIWMVKTRLQLQGKGMTLQYRLPFNCFS
jgi:solute carrier family 25 folate transporter 32